MVTVSGDEVKYIITRPRHCQMQRLPEREKARILSSESYLEESLSINEEVFFVPFVDLDIFLQLSSLALYRTIEIPRRLGQSRLGTPSPSQATPTQTRTGSDPEPEPQWSPW